MGRGGSSWLREISRGREPAAALTIQLVAGEFNEVALHGDVPSDVGQTTSITPAAPHSNLIAAGRCAP